MQVTQDSQSILGVGGGRGEIEHSVLTLSNFKAYYKTTLIKTCI